jgi:hypothetical protein
MQMMREEIKKSSTTVNALKNQLTEKETEVIQIAEVKSSLECNVDVSKKELETLYREKLDLQNRCVMVQQVSDRMYHAF